MSRGRLLLLPVVATIRSKISEPRKVGISSQASSCERVNKDVYWRRKGSVRQYPHCYSKYLKFSQACNGLNNVKRVLFLQNLTFHVSGYKESFFYKISLKRNKFNTISKLISQTSAGLNFYLMSLYIMYDTAMSVKQTIKISLQQIHLFVQNPLYKY